MADKLHADEIVLVPVPVAHRIISRAVQADPGAAIAHSCLERGAPVFIPDRPRSIVEDVHVKSRQVSVIEH
jgi:hypothetical protein